MRWLIILLLLKTKCQAEEWDANNFPNPTAGQFLKCRMKTTANICDPDGVLSEQARYRLDHDLKQLESRTRQDHGRTFCEKKGVTAAMAVTRHVKGGSIEAVKMMANDILRKWTLDTQCQKAVVFVVSTDDMKFWVARDDRVPVYADEFTEIFEQQKSLFQQSNHQQALTNIMQKTWEKALSKQGSPKAGGGQPGPYPPSGGDSGMMDGGFKGKGGPDFKMPSIPGWFWAALVLVIIPLLCLCICCYCCCCRGKGSAGARAASRGVPMTDDGGMGGGSHRGGGGAGSMFRNIAGSAGGAGIGSLLGNLISGRRARGMGGGRYGGGMGMGGYGGGGYQGGGAYPAAPAIYDDNAGEGGGGLYPSKAVKDQGGGGSWA
ncbi:hypothetical protein DICVIV_06243 [Dictyocaulus viviparus]|uniref:TPM domain-containing protein n=1 Tax=Dictyocaulus viviparus TaxID=29172 RepID=A0A0D8XZC7_DICVI|nr:hypothetical protein DICVIV_06243 [Dictyocaulus viviparus]